MAFYIKVSLETAVKLGMSEDRNRTADGHVLLWQADVDAQPGDTIFDRVAHVGGICLTPSEARDEIDGVGTPRALPGEIANMEPMEPPTPVQPADPSTQAGQGTASDGTIQQEGGKV